MTDKKLQLPIYPSWIRTNKIILFWFIGGIILLSSIFLTFFWTPSIYFAIFSLPFLYIGLILTLTNHQLSKQGNNVQYQLHELINEQIKTSKNILDIGCGSGQLLIAVAKKNIANHYVGVDYWGDDWTYSQLLCEQNAKNESISNIHFQKEDASMLSFDDNSFQTVISCLTFHEVKTTKDKTIAIREALRVLEPGGTFVFLDLFDDPNLYGNRNLVLKAIKEENCYVTSVSSISNLLTLKYPLNTKKVLKYAVLISGTKN